MSKLVIVGCSVTSGTGFDPADLYADCPHAPELWVNLLYNDLPRLRPLEMINLAEGGASNNEIFAKAIHAIANIINDHTSELWCQWTNIFRIKFHAGFELYPTKVHSATLPREVRTNQFVLQKKFLSNLWQDLRSIIHPHKEICDILQYVDVINALCDKHQIKVHHINAACPWDKNYFVRLTGSHVKPTDYTAFTQEKILFVNNRHDDEISQLYHKLHDDYKLIHTQADSWLNLNDSFLSLQKPGDFNGARIHPGRESHLNFFNFLRPLLTN